MLYPKSVCSSAKAPGQADLSICQVFGPKQSKRRSMPAITGRQQAAKPPVDAPVHCEVGVNEAASMHKRLAAKFYTHSRNALIAARTGV